jgi:hypothetical protein
MSPSLDDTVAKHDSQIGAVMSVLTRIDERTKATHRVVVASSIIGPPHRATLGLSALALAVACASLALTLGACK